MIIEGQDVLIEIEQKGWLNKLRAYVRAVAKLPDKHYCPFCDKLVKVYARTIHAEMARFLIMLYTKDRVYPR